MPYEWDKAKAADNVAKHGLSFDAIEAFDWASARIEADMRPGDPEGRLVALGLIDGRVHMVAFVIRRGVRIISLRRASSKEIDRYEAKTGQEYR